MLVPPELRRRKPWLILFSLDASLPRFVKTSFSSLDTLLCESEHTDAASLDRLAADHPPENSLLLYLVDLVEAGEPRVQCAATALLKRYQETDAVFVWPVVRRLLDVLPCAQCWEATLHLLQILPRLPIPFSRAESLCDVLYDLSKHSNIFVRAWAYSGLHRIAELHPAYRSEVSPLLERAAHEETASVRARLRQLPPLADMPLSPRTRIAKRLTTRCSQPLAGVRPSFP